MPDPIKPDWIMGGKVRLRRKTPADAREDYRWQKDPELASLDATTPLRCTFDEYYEDDWANDDWDNGGWYDDGGWWP